MLYLYVSDKTTILHIENVYNNLFIKATNNLHLTIINYILIRNHLNIIISFNIKSFNNN